MKYSSRWYRSVLSGIALIAGLGLFTTQALAQFLPSGTTTAGGISANTTITNNAILNYSVAGTAQPQIDTAVSGGGTSFVVDNKVNVLVAESGGAPTNVAPNATSQVTTFTVTNAGNSPMDFSLAAAGNVANGVSVTLGGTPFADSNATAGFDVAGCVVRVESGATLGFQPLEDTDVAIRNLSPVGGSNSKTVYVLCNIPSAVTATNNNNALVALIATTNNVNTCIAATGAGCATTTQTPGGDTPGTVDVVFADAIGPADTGPNATTAPDGTHSAYDVYRVSAAVLSVSKTVTAICDPFNGNTNPKSIPGAYVQYEITIANAVGAASATLTDITDALNANTAFDADLRTGAGGVAPNRCTSSPPASAAGSGFRLRCTGTTRASGAGTCANAAGQFFTGAADGDAASIAGQNITFRFGTGGGAVTGAQALPAEAGPGYSAGELKGGESVTIRFNAIIN